MILGKLWKSLAAQMNKIANFFWTADPIAQLQYEYDKAVDQLKEGREGLEQYRALVERVTRQVNGDRQHAASLEARVKAYLKAGERDTASKFALELQKARKELAENEAQLQLHETAYENNVTKVKHASKKLADLKTKIQQYDADLKLSRAEAELAKLATTFNFDVTTDFGQIEEVIQDKIGLNRAKVRVAADHTYLRAGPSDDFYPTERLGQDAEVEIWAFDASGYAAVRPVAGSFSWVLGTGRVSQSAG